MKQPVRESFCIDKDNFYTKWGEVVFGLEDGKTFTNYVPEKFPPQQVFDWCKHELMFISSLKTRMERFLEVLEQEIKNES